MKRIFALVALSFCISVPSFAGNVVGHSAKAVSKGTTKAATVTAKGAANGAKAVGKFLF